MTHIILHGGYPEPWAGAGEDETLFNALIEQAKAADSNLLISFLAQNKKEDFPHLDALKNYFKSNSPSIELKLVDQNDFLDHVSDYKVLFMQGGNSLKQEAFHKTLERDQILENKTCIAGSSSGAMMIAHHGISSHEDGIVVKGHGILDFAVIPHADAWPLNQYIPIVRSYKSLPILCLDENQMVQLKR